MGGHIIIRSDIKAALQAPLVWAGLPTDTQTKLTPIFAKPEANWTEQECRTVGNAANWALCNL